MYEDSLLKSLEALDYNSVLIIIKELCKDEKIAKRVAIMAKTILTDVDVEVIATNVFASLNSIQVEDLWDNSGKTRYGYKEPTEVAFEMCEARITPYVGQMGKYRELKMKKQEKDICIGILFGIFKYIVEGNNEFHEWAIDDPYIIAENIISDWIQQHCQEDAEEIQLVYKKLLIDNEEEFDL